MTKIAFHPEIAPEIRKTILAHLCDVETSDKIRILFAIESGSRAWGFPSPDSDFDVRFVYARPSAWYLSLRPGRDVIELPLEHPLDINGWDIKKALNLLLKPNPVLLEWLSSPLHYLWDDEPCQRLVDFAQKTAFGPACLYHYRHLGERQWRIYLDGQDKVNLKKYFYVVRPAMAVRWIRLRPEAIPPMNFQTLMEGLDLSHDLTVALEDLLVRKSQTKELGEAPRIAVIDEFIASEFAWAESAAPAPKAERPDLRNEADTLFRYLIKAC